MAVPDDLALPVAVAFPEAGVRPLSGDLAEIGSSADAVVVGPGFDDPDTTTDVLRRLLPGLADEVTVVLDAFSLGVLPDLRELADPLRGRAVLTPNSREAARLLGVDDVGDRDEDDVAQAIADDFGCVASYQDYVAVAGGQLRQITTGHSGLGTSGSGDVLAGAIGGLLARGAPPKQAACWGTHLHASAGDRLAARIGRLGFLARELADELPVLLTELLS